MGKQTAGQSKAFGKCLKTGLRSGAIASKTTLSECVDAMRADPGSKVAKLATKVVSEATRRCEGLVLADMFPGECALASDLGVCASSVAACSVCRRVVRGQELIADCDAFDDGLVNGTCGPRSY